MGGNSEGEKHQQQGQDTALPSFTWDEIRKHNNAESCWLVIHGNVYDTTSFLSKHPGGEDMMLMGAGRECGTELFESHHPLYMMEKTTENSMLKKYLIGKLATDENTAADPKKKLYDVPHLYNPASQTNFYITLKRRVEETLKKNNKTPRDAPEMYIKSMVCFVVWLVFYVWLQFYVKNFWLTTIFSLIYGWAFMTIGISVMHDGNHGGYSDSPVVNRIAGGVFDFFGGSSYVWRMIHSVGHHVQTNVEEKDPDIQTHEPHFRRIKAGQKFHFWYRYQQYYLPLLYSTLLFELFIRDFIAMFTGKWGGVKFQPVPRREWIIFFATKIWYVTYNIVIPLMFNDAWRVFYIFVLGHLVASEMLVLIFQVNHVTAVASRYNIDNKGIVNADWAVSQVCGSSNFAAGSWLWNMLSGGLNHQIEHHLFPTISHVHYPLLYPIVKQTCQEYGLPYNNYSSFWTAVKGHFELLENYSREGKVFPKPSIH